jgi:hypothetical protein
MLDLKAAASKSKAGVSTEAKDFNMEDGSVIASDYSRFPPIAHSLVFRLALFGPSSKIIPLPLRSLSWYP